MSTHNTDTHNEESKGSAEAERLTEIVTGAQSVVFFGGAGISTESGIPDFRSDTGLYTTESGGKYPPEYMLSHSCFVEHPLDFYSFYRNKMLYPDAKPNAAHRALAALERRGTVRAVVTQNIDGLHQAAGSHTVYELHGSVHRNFCVDCGAAYTMEFIRTSSGIPRCTQCGGIIKPDVVLYEEPLDENIIDSAVAAISAADVLIVGGTSLNVYPAAGLIHYFNGSHLILINKSVTPADAAAELAIHDSLGTVLSSLVDPADLAS
ncbi:MAG: NAD-dependent protein deacylase [Actinomycetaceae bacterium]|nr:NAD-dependent protein deacylase [Actinomycetaceae bacterium]MDY6082425.1 NAD-dependent protein deacylase [Actinomycetaceae bacterium]